MDNRMPAEVFPPGEYLADELQAREWSQADFADIVGRPVQWVSELINGRKEITAESATQLAAALGTSADTWLSLQARFRLWQVAQDAEKTASNSRVTTRARIASIIPLAVLEKRGLVDVGADPDRLLQEVMDDFHMTSEDDPPRFQLAAKRSNPVEELNLPQRGWLWAARRAALSQTLPPYEEANLRRLAEGLTREISEPADMEDLPARFAEVGVHLVFVEHLPGGKIDGAAFMLGGHPVIAVSGRGKRFDKLFFALMHEVAHVLRGHTKDSVALDDAADVPNRGEEKQREAEANEYAESLSLGGRVRIPAPLTANSVSAKAVELGVPFAFVVGNLQHHHDLDWRTTLAKGLPNADDVLRSWVSPRSA